MPTTPRPILSIQTASLWASGDATTFTGNAGPGYDPFLGTFDGVVSSALIATSPFNDRLFGVAGGDQVVFVIVVQNFAPDARGYDIKLRNLLPVGFALPPGDNVQVTDGAGLVLASSGNLFDPAGGLVIDAPLGVFSNTSGANVALVTFTLRATPTLAVPLANITDTAQIVSYAASGGGANLAPSATVPLSASTPVQTGTLQAAVAGTPASAPLASGQTTTFDITVSLPQGTVQDLRLNELTPLSGNAGLSLISAQIVRFGADLTASLPVIAQPDGSVLLGNVTDASNGIQGAADQFVVRVTVGNGGSSAGTGTLNTVLSALDPNTPGHRWSTTLTSTVPLAKPNVPPTIAGISPAQNTTSTTPVYPFAQLALADPDAGQTEVLTIHLSDPALGTLGGVGALSTNQIGDYVLSGSVAAVQAAARALRFTPAANASGTETFGLTLNDGATGIATDQHTALAIAPAASPSDLPSFPISTQTVLTSTATGSSTVAAIESYLGPIDSVQSQFLYSGTAPLAIVAQQPNMLISSRAIATAVQLASGRNVIDVRNGSTFATSGGGSDEFLFHADQAQVTWNTIVNFHPGDSLTIFGFNAAAGSYYWDPSSGASGYTGATLRMDLNRDGRIDSSVTFAGRAPADISHLSLVTGSVGGSYYLQVTPV